MNPLVKLSIVLLMISLAQSAPSSEHLEREKRWQWMMEWATFAPWGKWDPSSGGQFQYQGPDGQIQYPNNGNQQQNNNGGSQQQQSGNGYQTQDPKTGSQQQSNNGGSQQQQNGGGNQYQYQSGK